MFTQTDVAVKYDHRDVEPVSLQRFEPSAAVACWRGLTGGGDCVTCSSFNHRADQTSDTDVNETRSRLLLSHRARSVGKPFPFLSETTHRGWSTCVTINVKVYYDCYGCLAVIFQNKMQVFDGFSFSNVKKMSLFLVLHYSILSFFKFWTICWTKEDFL